MLAGQFCEYTVTDHYTESTTRQHQRTSGRRCRARNRIDDLLRDVSPRRHTIAIRGPDRFRGCLTHAESFLPSLTPPSRRHHGCFCPDGYEGEY